MEVHQYDLSGNYIASYPSYSEAARTHGVNESTIRKGTKYNATVMGKFKFTLDNTSPLLKSVASTGEVSRFPKILIIDIETAPLRSYTWGLWKQNVGLNQIISNWFMISYAAKILGSDEILSGVLTSKEALAEDDSRIIQNLWNLLDKADIVIAHNGDRFDIPKINTRFVLHGLVPPSPYRQIDTLTVARLTFGFTSNRLDFLAKFLGYQGKEPTTFELWEECMAGNPEALFYMEFYNKKDVVILEDVYLRLRPYIKGHSNLDLYMDTEEPRCPHCGDQHVSLLQDKYFYTQAVRYAIYRCDNCGAVSRAKKGTPYINKRVISAIPK